MLLRGNRFVIRGGNKKSLPGMDIYQLRYFVAVAEELSFRRAAERLHITRPPLTRQIAALEAEIKARLLERDRRRAVSLTDAGHAFLIHAKRALQSADEAGECARQAARGTAGCLAVAGCALLAAPVLGIYLHEFRRKFPLVEVSFTDATQAQELKALSEGRVHLAISATFGEELASCFRAQVLGTVPLFVVLPTRHPLAQRPGKQVELSDLQAESLLRPSPESKPTYAGCLDQICALTGFIPHGIRQVDGIENILAMVAAGYGVAILAGSSAHLPMPGCEVKRLRLPLPPYQLRMLWRREVTSPLLRNFLAMAGRVRLPNGLPVQPTKTPAAPRKKAAAKRVPAGR